MSHVLADHGLLNLAPVASWPQALALPRHEVALAVLGLEAGFETDDLARHRRAGHPRRPAGAAAPRTPSAPENFIAEVTSLVGRRPRRPRRSRHRPLRRPARHRGRRRAARLPGDPLCRRRQAVPAGREHRAAVALRLGGDRRRARPARRRRLAGAQGADEEAHPRDRRAS